MKFLITGANSGLGYYSAETLLRSEGNQVYITARDLTKGKEAISQLEKISHPSSKVHLVQLDVTDDASIEKAAALPELQELDVLINNAGIAGSFTPEKSELRNNLRSVFEANVFGASIVTETFIPALNKSKHKPTIVFVSSGLASVTNRIKNFEPDSDTKGSTNLLAYNSSKTALNGIAAYFSNDQPKMRIVCVAPGHCATNLNNHKGAHSPQSGAEVIVKAALDIDGKTGTFVSRDGVVPW